MTSVHFTITLSPSIAVNSTGKVQSSSPAIDSARNRAKASMPSTRARATPTAGQLSVGGLIKHVASVERTWMDVVLQKPRGNEADYEANFRFGPDETLADVLAAYDDTAKSTDAVIDGIADLGQPVPV